MILQSHLVSVCVLPVLCNVVWVVLSASVIVLLFCSVNSVVRLLYSVTYPVYILFESTCYWNVVASWLCFLYAHSTS